MFLLSHTNIAFYIFVITYVHCISGFLLSHTYITFYVFVITYISTLHFMFLLSHTYITFHVFCYHIHIYIAFYVFVITYVHNISCFLLSHTYLHCILFVYICLISSHGKNCGVFIESTRKSEMRTEKPGRQKTYFNCFDRIKNYVGGVERRVCLQTRKVIMGEI